VRIPGDGDQRSELMPISSERSDAGHSQCETVIDIVGMRNKVQSRVEHRLDSAARAFHNKLSVSALQTDFE
jgi:hypothetical protein